MRTKRWSRGASLVAFAFFAFCFLICLIIAVVCFTDAAGGIDDSDIVRGKFHVSSEAEDPVTGISGAVVLRTTKMLQYREKSYEHTDGSYTYEVEEVWEEKHIESFFQGFQQYNNPDFPEELKTEAWKLTYKILWAEYHCCYYSCKRMVFTAFNDDSDTLYEIYELVNELTCPMTEPTKRYPL